MKVLNNSLEIKKILINQDDINNRVKQIGAQITEDYKDKNLVIIGIIKGSLYFCTDLTSAIDLPVEVDFLGFGNLPNSSSKKIIRDIDIDISGKHVILVEDIIRTGLTACYLVSHLESKKPASISVCSLLMNPDRLLLPAPVKYTGFEIGDKWLVGYGLDINQIGRNLPYIAEIECDKK